MKRIGYVFVLVLICSSVGAGLPPDKTFTASGEILTGEEWTSVYIHGDDTVVDMSGGTVSGIKTYDASTLNVSGSDGYIFPRINALNASLVNILDIPTGVLAEVAVRFDATVNVYAGVQSGNFEGDGDGTINFFGGNISDMHARERSVFNLFEVDVSAPLRALSSAIVNFYGYDLAKTDTGGQDGYGQVTGFWQSGTPFTIDLALDAYDHINLIPEPGSAALLMVGIGGFLRKRRSG